MGRLLTIPVTSVMWGTSSSWLSCVHPIPSNIPSNTRHTVPICYSHTCPKCDACGGLNIQPCSATNFWTRVWSISESACSNCDFPPTKLLLWSHTCISFVTDPRMVKNHPSAQMNKLVSIVSSTSMWMAPLLRQVQMRPLGFGMASPPLSLLVEFSQGPKASKLTFVKGGLVSVWSTSCNLCRIL